MANFDEIVQKTAETAEVIADRSSVYLRKAADGAKTVMRAGKLKMDIAAEKDCMRRSYSALGKLYYQLHKDDPEEELAQIVADIALSESKIEAMREEYGDIMGDGVEIEVEIVKDDAEEDAPAEEAPAEEAPEAPAEEKPEE